MIAIDKLISVIKAQENQSQGRESIGYLPSVNSGGATYDELLRQNKRRKYETMQNRQEVSGIDFPRKFS